MDLGVLLVVASCSPSCCSKSSLVGGTSLLADDLSRDDSFLKGQCDELGDLRSQSKRSRPCQALTELQTRALREFVLTSTWIPYCSLLRHATRCWKPRGADLVSSSCTHSNESHNQTCWDVRRNWKPGSPLMKPSLPHSDLCCHQITNSHSWRLRGTCLCSSVQQLHSPSRSLRLAQQPGAHWRSQKTLPLGCTGCTRLLVRVARLPRQT